MIKSGCNESITEWQGVHGCRTSLDASRPHAAVRGPLAVTSDLSPVRFGLAEPRPRGFPSKRSLFAMCLSRLNFVLHTDEVWEALSERTSIACTSHCSQLPRRSLAVPRHQTLRYRSRGVVMRISSPSVWLYSLRPLYILRPRGDKKPAITVTRLPSVVRIEPLSPGDFDKLMLRHSISCQDTTVI